MLKGKTYSLKGIKLEEISLPKEFGEKENPSLLAQAVRVYEERSHVGLAKTKTRTEVNRTTKKVYKQKGTGGARHGARSAPIYVGGGTAHGPKPIRRILTLPKKMTKLALSQSLSMKLSQKQVFVISGIEKIVKTKEARDFLKKLTKSEDIKIKKFTLILSKKNIQTKRFLKNLENVRIEIFENMNAFKVLLGGILIFDKEIFVSAKAVGKLGKEAKK